MGPRREVRAYRSFTDDADLKPPPRYATNDFEEFPLRDEPKPAIDGRQDYIGYATTTDHRRSARLNHPSYVNPGFEEVPLGYAGDDFKDEPTPILAAQRTSLLPPKPTPDACTEWRPGAFRKAPWTGLSALLIALLSAVSTVGVLFSAEGKATETWPTKECPIQLAVVLAVLVAIANASLAFAHVEGVTISWWVKMLQGGSLRDSHRYWEHGSSAWKSVVQLNHLSKVTLTSLIMVLLLLDGPLLQRAATFETVSVSEPTTFKARLSDGVLSQSTAYYMSHAAGVNTLSPNFSQVVQNFSGRKPIVLDVLDCLGTCEGTVIAAGFDTRCNISNVAYDLDIQPGDSVAIGSINVTSNGIVHPGIVKVATLYKPSAKKKGNLIKTECAMHIGQVKYPLRVSNGTATLQSSSTNSSSKGINGTVALDYPQRETAGLGIFPSLLGGISYAVSSIYSSDVQLYDSGVLALLGEGPMQYTYLNSSDSALGSSRVSWEDPTPYVLEAVHELTFRAAVAFSNASYYQSVNGTQEATSTKYVLKGKYLGGTMGVIVLSTLAVSWLFHGYWLLGRRVSMSPVEIAKAFEAPMAAGADSNADTDVLLKQIGERKAQYGVLRSRGGDVDPFADSGDGTMAIASPGSVWWPKRD